MGPLRSRIKDTIFDIVREHGDWIADADIAEEMTKRGIPFVKRMLMDRLGDAVRRGELDRRSNSYRAVPISEVKL